MRFIGIQLLQCNFGAYDGLDGHYTIEDYKLIPCIETILSQERPSQTLILSFPFDGKSGKGNNNAAKAHFQNKTIMANKAKKFVAWLTLMTGIPIRLFYSGFGGTTFAKMHHVPSQDFIEEKALATFNPDPGAILGKFENVKRPFLSEKTVKSGETLKLPSDMTKLTSKLFSLPSKKRRQYCDACSTLQFGLEVWGTYPTVTLAVLVSTVESMMADEFVSIFCEDANRNCSLKSGVTKKFRLFFERTLLKPLPKDLRMFLNKVYSKRSKYVHRALLGEIGLCGPYQHYSKTSKIYSELRYLLRLVRAGLIQWLIEA